MNKIKKYIKEGLFFALILFIISNGLSYYRSIDLNKNRFDLKNIILIDNTIFKYDKTKPLLIHFWATWCPICKIEAPNIQELSKGYNVLTIAVNSSNNDNIKQYLKKQNVTFKVLNDIDYSIAKKFNIEVYPTTLIYDKNHNLIFSEVGYTSTVGLKLRMWWASL